MSRVLLVDGNWFLYRVFSVAVYRKSLINLSRSIPSQFLSMVAKDFMAVRATHLAVSFDAPKSFRYKIYPRYKDGRTHKKTLEEILGKDTPKDLPPELRSVDPYTFMPSVKTCLTASGICIVTIPKRESDDVMASGALCLSEAGASVVIETRDKDLMQVVSDRRRISLYWPQIGQSPPRIIDNAAVKDIKGIPPKLIRDYLCLTGDSVDNIPGVPGVAHATALAILRQNGTIKEALKAKSKHGQRLRDHVNKLLLARKLVTLDTECWQPRLKDVALGELDEDSIVNILGKVPSGIEELHAQKALSSQKGLFS
jgi:DNA polymerase-1